jgi:hypothetical protein
MKVRHAILVALLAVVIAADHSKLSAEVKSKFYNEKRANGEEQTGNVWVFFADKGPFEKPIGLSERAINRRKKVNKGITEQDVPVYENYVATIQELIPTCKIRAKSNWLNAISIIDITREQLENIAELSIVTKVEIVAQYRRENPTQSIEESIRVNTRDIPLSYGVSYVQLNQMKATDAHARGTFILFFLY